jgi:hypothetical protein
MKAKSIAKTQYFMSLKLVSLRFTGMHYYNFSLGTSCDDKLPWIGAYHRHL